MSKTSDLRATIYYLIPSVVANALPIVSLPFLTRVLTPADFGLIALAQVFGLVVFGVANLGLTTAYERDFFKYRDDAAKSGALYWSCYGFILAVGSFFTLLAHFGAPWVDRWVFHAESPKYFVALAAIGALVRGLNQIGYQYLRNSEWPRPFVAISIFEGVSGFAVTLFLVVGLRWGPLGAIVGQTVAPVFAAFLLALFVSRRLKIAWDAFLLKEALKLGAPVTPKVFLGLASGQLDKYLLGFVSALGEVGIYSLAQRAGQVVYFLMNSMDYVFIPKVYKWMFESRQLETEGRHEEASEVARRIGAYLTPFIYSSCGISLSIALISEDVFKFLTTETFQAAILIAPILCLFYSTMIFGKVNGRQIVFA
ncbi:MAG: oligosaccharide flippase family protein, partial [Bdellovibrionota bacterium]